MEQYFTQHHISLFMVASALSYGATQIVKPFIWATCDDKSNAIIRLLAVIMGGIVGYSLSKQVLDLWIGAGAGVFNATTVSIINHKIKQRYSVSSEQEQEGEDG